MNILSHPILSCEETRAFEVAYFGDDEALEWTAMQRAGRAVSSAVQRDFNEIGPFPATARVLVLAGKGHNAGDAFIAAQNLLEYNPQATAEVLFFFGERPLRPLACRAWRALVHAAPDRIKEVTPGKQVVWEWQSKPVAPYTGPVEIHGFQRLADGRTMIAETGNLRIIEVDAGGSIVASVPLKVEKFQPHTKVRMHCSLVCPPDDLYAVDCDFPRQPIGASCKPRHIVASAHKSSSNT
jgi:hypothetical protein